MALGMDPEVLEALAPLMAKLGDAEPPAVGDYRSRREMITVLFEVIKNNLGENSDVSVTSHRLARADAEIELRWYTRDGEQPGSAAVFLHGGGMIMGSLDMYDTIIKHYVSATGVPMLAPEYRLAPEHPHPVPVEDCYAALVWLGEHAAELGVDPARIGVIGDSAGGGLAAGTALIARDRGGPALAQQILIYPMIDDRNRTPDPAIAPYLVWTYDDNATGWDLLLAGHDADAYAAPARADSVSDLPPTYIDVGDLDAFRDEDVEYARRLIAAGVPTELHVHPGCPHAFEGLAPNAAVARRAMADRFRRVCAL